MANSEGVTIIGPATASQANLVVVVVVVAADAVVVIVFCVILLCRK